MAKNPRTGDNIWIYVGFAILAAIVLAMVNSKNEKVRKAGIALLIVLVVAGSITIITINKENKDNEYNQNAENKNTFREINEDMIFIPIGISDKDRNKYELTQYINDVTAQNTQVLMEYSTESGKVAYNYGNERLSYEASTGTYQYNYDGRENVTNLLDSSSTSVVQYNYNPFGETTINGSKTDELENVYQFNAEATDSTTGLQYLRARYYDSSIGRFTTQDTYAGDITNPLSRNLYLYTNNDPVNYVDPSGHSLSSLLSVASQAVSAVGGIINKISSVFNRITEKSEVVRSVKKVIANAENRAKVQKPENKIIAGPRLNEAATNSNIEKSRQLENQIKYLRSQNTPEANKLADYIQANMKKLCESDLNRVKFVSITETKSYQIRKKALENIINSRDNSLGWINYMNEKISQGLKSTFSGAYGATLSLATTTIGGTGGILEGSFYSIIGERFEDGYNKVYEEFSKPLIESGRELVPDKASYDMGYKLGAIAQLVYGVKNIANIFKGGNLNPLSIDVGSNEKLAIEGANATISAGASITMNAGTARAWLEIAENINSVVNNVYNYQNAPNNGDSASGGGSSSDESRTWKRNIENTNELNESDFKNLSNNGNNVKVNRSGGDRPVYGEPNSYSSTANGEHVFVYDNDGKLIYDLSAKRVKAFRINVNDTGAEFFQEYKPDGEVPEFIKDIFGW